MALLVPESGGSRRGKEKEEARSSKNFLVVSFFFSSPFSPLAQTTPLSDTGQ